MPYQHGGASSSTAPAPGRRIGREQEARAEGVTEDPSTSTQQKDRKLTRKEKRKARQGQRQGTRRQGPRHEVRVLNEGTQDQAGHQETRSQATEGEKLTPATETGDTQAEYEIDGSTRA